MERVNRVPIEIAGVPDAVELKANCVHTTFNDKKMGQTLLPCSIKANWSNGVMSVGFTLKGKHQMVAVRMDEVLAVLAEASAARDNSNKTAEDKQ